MTELEKQLLKIKQLSEITELLAQLAKTVSEKEAEKSAEQERRKQIENLLIHDVPHNVDEAYKVVLGHIENVAKSLNISVDIHFVIKEDNE